MSEKYLGENSTPILINQIKDKLEENYKVMGELGAKNLIPYPYLMKTKTNNGVTITDNGDGTLTVNGTAQTAIFFNLCNIDFGDVPIGSANSEYIMSDGVDHSLNLEVGYNPRNKITSLNIWQGAILDNVTVYPMVRYKSDTDDTWQPYAPTNRDLFLNKMDNVNPTGTGVLSLNRKENTSIGNMSVAEGNACTASGNNSHAEGNACTASGNNSHAEGDNSRASGNNSHTEGQFTTASGICAHAEGNSCGAQGNYSHVEGSGCGTRGNFAHAQNHFTNANGMAQTVIGEYNIVQGTASSKQDTDYALIIGNGTADNARSNALAVQWDGTVVFQDNSTMKSAKTVYEVMGKMGAKNLIAYPYSQSDVTSRGITYTVQSDGSILASGTSTDYSYIDIINRGQGYGIYLKPNDYILSLGIFNDMGEKIDIDRVTVIFRFFDINLQDYIPSIATVSYGIRTQKFTITPEIYNKIQSGEYRIQLRLYVATSGIVIPSGTRFCPMIRLASDPDNTWTPYAPSNKELYDDTTIIDISNSFYTELSEGISLSDVAVYKQGKHIFGSFLMNGLTAQDGVKLYLTYAPKLKTHTFCSIYNAVKNVVLNVNGTLYVQGANGVGRIVIDYVCA